jgi:GH24 family phage-related lysozyme (muramidase)
MELPGRGTLQDKIYVGFVKYVADVATMGRLKVWIPELSGDPADEHGWYIVNYCSPFAGSTNIISNTNSNSFEGTQKSYGMWFVPPDINNEVVCAFINGDPGRGVWLGCLYQQNMNHMVPGLPGNNSTASLPVAEYNKKVKQPTLQSPSRPLYEPLADQLVKQGLNTDTLRGVSDSGARRTNPQLDVYGVLTPGGNQLVFDDNPANSYIRLRTQSGAQIIINDTSGFIYLNSVDGKNWISMDAGGKIDIYAASDISVRSQGSLNFRADQDVNIEAGQNINMRARGSTATTPVANPAATTQPPTPPPTPPSILLGDSIAAALSSRLTSSTSSAGTNVTSSDIVKSITSNDSLKNQPNAVLSVGTYDFVNNNGNLATLSANLSTIREYLAASNYVWLLPYNPTAKSTVQTFASSKGDQTIDLSTYPTTDNINPKDFNVVANDVTQKLKPVPSSNSTTSSNTVSTSNATTSSSNATTSSSNATTSSSNLNPPPSAANTTTSSSTTTSSYIDIVVPFLQSEEGKANAAYWDGPSQRTLVSIGYGHQIKSNEYSQGYIDTGTAGRIAVTRPNPNSSTPGCGTANDAQCQALLTIDVPVYAAVARSLLRGAWDVCNAYQQAACVSICYGSPEALKRLIGQGLTTYISNGDQQSAATLIQNAGPAILTKRRAHEAQLYLGKSTVSPLTGNSGYTGIPGTGEAQHSDGTILEENPNTINGYIRIQSSNDMHLVSGHNMFITSVADIHRFAGSNMFDTAGINWNRGAGGYVHDSAGGDFAVSASSEINISGKRIDMNGAAAPASISAVAGVGPTDLKQQDGILNTLGNVVPTLTDTIVYHLPYHEPYDDHGGRSTYGIQNSTQVDTKTNLRDGEVIQNSEAPLNLIGTPTKDMPSGVYLGASYNISNQPVYAYQGSASNVALQGVSGLQLSDAGSQFIQGYENGGYIKITVGNPPVSQIGYGHNLTASEISSNTVTIGGIPTPLTQPITQQQVSELFNEDMTAVQNWMRPVLGNVAVTQTQYDMFCSLAFNIGQQNFTNSNAVKQVLAGNLQKVPPLWMQHTVDGSGNVVPSLVVRRRAEVTKFMLAPFKDVIVISNITTNSSSTSSSSGFLGKLQPNR